jgi:hypothetical protein
MITARSKYLVRRDIPNSKNIAVSSVSEQIARQNTKLLDGSFLKTEKA